MKNYNFTTEHQEFRTSFRKFLDKEVVPFIDEWENQNSIPKEIWRKMGEMGYLGLNFPERYGGLGLDFYFSLIFCEEVSKCFSGGFSFSALISQYMAAPYIYKYGSDHLKHKYLSPTLTGERICAVTLKDFSSEKEQTTTARLEGDCYFVNGSKTFVVNGSVADYLITAVQTRENEMSLLIIDGNLEGISIRKVDKIGWYAADVADVFFDNVEVSQENLLGELGKGKEYEAGSWQLEKLVTSIVAVTSAEFALHYAMKYMNEREAFGRKINRFQVLRHRVAHMIAEIETVKEYAYYCCDLHNKGAYALQECTMVRLKAMELASKVLDRSLQFLGGYGYTGEFKIARMYRDIQVAAVVGGTPEHMCRLISEIAYGVAKHRIEVKSCLQKE